MANLAVFASGNGSNFQSIAEVIVKTEHSIEFLLCNQKSAFAVERAKKLKVKVYTVDYRDKKRESLEAEIIKILNYHKIDLIALAGYMKILTPFFVNTYKNRIINIHPSLLPKYPGAEGIVKSYNSKDRELGITIHYVDTGVDTGEIILQKSFVRTGKESLKEVEERIHTIEHLYYPQVVLELLNRLGEKG
ncbi:MAG: phosphoribosylglycinamide formyltransferase [Spirochaetes bacterium]|nr:phosphoribosylglycinamide formyltransferase [Spirochaetota bacterium]